MKYGVEREISDEIYERCIAKGNHKTLASEDYNKVFTASEMCGYGIYNERIIDKNGKHYVKFDMGDSCD